MKMKYVKPLISVERFGLTQSIAEYCGYKDEKYLGSPVNAGDRASCGWAVNDGSGEILWVGSNGSCNQDVGLDYIHEEICYNNPDGPLTVFGSV